MIKIIHIKGDLMKYLRLAVPFILISLLLLNLDIIYGQDGTCDSGDCLNGKGAMMRLYGILYGTIYSCAHEWKAEIGYPLNPGRQ